MKHFVVWSSLLFPQASLLMGDVYSGLRSGIPRPCRLLSGLRGLKPLPTFLDLPPRLSYVVELRFSPRRDDSTFECILVPVELQFLYSRLNYFEKFSISSLVWVILEERALTGGLHLLRRGIRGLSDQLP